MIVQYRVMFSQTSYLQFPFFFPLVFFVVVVKRKRRKGEDRAQEGRCKISRRSTHFKVILACAADSNKTTSGVWGWEEEGLGERKDAFLPSRFSISPSLSP